MAIIRDSAGASSTAVTPRVSTAEPVGVDRWATEVPEVDFSRFFEPGKFVEAPKASVGLQDLGLSGGLSLDSLLGNLSMSDQSSAPKARSWLTAYAPLPKYEAGRFDKKGLSQAMSGSVTGGSGSGYGPSAYGFKGTTGLDWMKGKAAFGFQTQMWKALSAANAAMKAAGVGTFGITDGWRSYSAQVAVKKKKGDLAATPGRSIHGLGLAADLRLTKAQFNWLKKNGARFGLVNLPSESWHWQLAPSVWGGTFDRKG